MRAGPLGGFSRFGAGRRPCPLHSSGDDSAPQLPVDESKSLLIGAVDLLLRTPAQAVLTTVDGDENVLATGGALNFTEYVQAGDTVALNDTIKTLDVALATLRTQAQNLGTNVAVLQTRLDFTESYVNTLEIGAAKLTLADLNEEGANLLALQTRHQLGIQALAFAGQAEQSILALFR